MKQKRKKGVVLPALGMAVLLILTAVLNVLSLTTFDGLFTAFFGTVNAAGVDKNSDAEYYTSDYKNAEELYDTTSALAEDIAEEGVTLLKNDNQALPLDSKDTVSLFGTASTNLVCGGSGSGAGSVELNVDLKTACERAGLKVNEDLWDFYESGNGKNADDGSTYGIGAGSIGFGASFDWSINECPAERIQAESGLEDTFAGTKAVYVISRTGGEDGDLSRDMAAYGGESGQSYLELDDTEKGILTYLDRTFDSFTVILNTNNPIAMQDLEGYKHLDAILNAPALGRMGAYGLANVLVGSDGENDISPSGHLTDTFAYDVFSAPAMQNMGDYKYSGTDYTYVAYNEGIYVGYRYYETRYEDAVMGQGNAGSYSYEDTVAYPFGYGLSYTTFDWSDFSLSQPDKNGDFTAKITVTNTGDYSGKDVVELYFQSPYTNYDKQNGIEKASVELCGYAKTKLLEPGEKETVELTFNKKELRTYDANNAKTYIVEGGEYYITAATDAHTAIMQILKSKGYDNESADNLTDTYVQEETDTTSYATDETTGQEITNQFDQASLDDTTMLSRSDWSAMDNDDLRYGKAGSTENPMEQDGLAFETTASDETLAALQSTDSLNPDPITSKDLPDRGEEHDLELVDLRGLDYDDPLWEQLVSELSLDDMRRIMYVNGYSALGALDAVNKPASAENDGPAGINDFQKHEAISTGDNTTTMTWPGEILLAATWNDDLALSMGKLIGEDGLYSKTVGWYGPAMNLHRTAFAGRNFEYYAEDPCISGRMAKQEVQGAASKGLICYIKHFALNDQETNRHGVATWCNEQAIRELYLEPFETAIKDNTVSMKYLDADGKMAEKDMPAAMALMTSYNRIGATWAGGNYNLLTNVLRGEWGFSGIILTDYNQNQTFMDTNQMLAAGGGSKLRTLDNDYTIADLKKTPGMATYVAEAAHRYLYAQANSAIVNHMSHGTKVSNGIPVYKLLLAGWDLIALVITIVLIRTIYKRKNKKKVVITRE